MSRMQISDNQWDQIKDHLPPETGRRGRPAKENRTVVNAILWILSTGASWRDVPKSYGPWNTIYTCFNRWSKKGLWQMIFQMLSRDSDNESKMPDGTVIRAHQHAAGAKGGQEKQALGRSVGGFSTKIHALVDALGYPVKIELTAGQVHDSTPAEKLLAGEKAEYVIADKAYDSKAFITLIKSQGSKPVIPSRKNSRAPRSYDKHIYKERHLVEIFLTK